MTREEEQILRDHYADVSPETGDHSQTADAIRSLLEALDAERDAHEQARKNAEWQANLAMTMRAERDAALACIQRADVERLRERAEMAESKLAALVKATGESLASHVPGVAQGSERWLRAREALRTTLTDLRAAAVAHDERIMAEACRSLGQPEAMLSLAALDEELAAADRAGWERGREAAALACEARATAWREADRPRTTYDDREENAQIYDASARCVRAMPYAATKKES